MLEAPEQYTQRICDLVSAKNPLEVQRETANTLAKLIKPLSREKLSQRLGPAKWSIAEIRAHLVDAEIVVSWRMRLVIGQSGAALQAVDQDSWAQTLDFWRQDPKVSFETFRLLRANNLRMLQAQPESVWENYGIHSKRGKETVTQIVRMYAGHDLNHVAQVDKIARESGSKRKGVG